ncbi:MAG: HU family DNA-binding protein [Beijerinckiaceae bacterium]
MVKLHGFGIFRVSDKAERPARNPRTGEFAVVHARRSISFRPSPLVIEQLNPHLSDSEAEDEPERVVASLNGRARTFA